MPGMSREDWDSGSSPILRAIYQAVEVVPVIEQPTEFLAARERQPHTRKMPAALEVADRPDAHPEVPGGTLVVEQARCQRAHVGHSSRNRAWILAGLREHP